MFRKVVHIVDTLLLRDPTVRFEDFGLIGVILLDPREVLDTVVLLFVVDREPGLCDTSTHLLYRWVIL